MRLQTARIGLHPARLSRAGFLRLCPSRIVTVARNKIDASAAL